MGPRHSCRNTFKKLPCEYVLFYAVCDNQNNLCSDLEVHGLITICQLQIFLFSRRAPCLLVLGYLIDRQETFSLRRKKISFKDNLVSYLLNNPFYTVAEFLGHPANNKLQFRFISNCKWVFTRWYYHCNNTTHKYTDHIHNTYITYTQIHISHKIPLKTNKTNQKNGVFWDVTPCGSCKNQRFGGTQRLLHQGDKNRWTRNNTSCN
jgi:hypothetical protein